MAPESQRFLVGVHFHRHFGGPGHVTVAPGEIVATDRRERRRVVHLGDTIRVERKRWEPPTGNRWIEISDGETTTHLTMGRRRAERVLAAMMSCGFSVEWLP